MNIDEKFSVKHWQTEFNKITRRPYRIPSQFHYRDSGMAQNTRINKNNTAYKQKQGQKSHDPLNRCRKSL
jgi:hypothetical protein